jgi:uncharacterized protein YbaR (Trm112 family)
MFVELIEQLRCPRPHEPAPLVVSAHEVRDRRVVQGVLGCPVCHTEFHVKDGVARFDGPVATGEPVPDSGAEAAMRLAAFLELTDARGYALLHGAWCVHAEQVMRLSDTPLVLVNPPSGVRPPDVAALVEVGSTLPFAPGSARGAAIAVSAGAPLTTSIIAAVRGGGRVVGPASVPVPAGLVELVRDEREWVCEKPKGPAENGIVRIGRGRPSGT